MIQQIENFLNQVTLSGDTLLAPWITTLVLVGVSLILYWIISRIFRKLDQHREDHLLILAWKKLRNPILATILLLDLIFLKGLFTLEEGAALFFAQFIKVAIIFCVTWILIRAIHISREAILKQYDIGEKDNLKARRVYTQFRVLERIVIFILIVVALAVALMTFEGIKRIGISLFASAGVAGIILGFAAQKMLGSILAGFQIALTQPIRIDDVVIVENEWGWIEEINLTYVVVRIWDKRRLIVPTTYFIEKPFQNWTRVSADILGTVFIYTDYTVPVDKLRDAFMDILKETDLWDGQVGVMQVTNATDHSMEIRALMSSVDSPTSWDLRVLIREKLIAYLQQHYPQSLPKTRVEMTSSDTGRE